MQGSGTFGNEAVLSCLPKNYNVNVFSNGIYGDRLYDIAKLYDYNSSFTKLYDNEQITRQVVENNISDNSLVSVVHHETTTGILNDINNICKIDNTKVMIDGISSFGGIPIDINELNCDFFVGSSNKCIHGFPGFSFIIIKKELMNDLKNNNRTLSLDLYSQWYELEKFGQFRFTPPVQIIQACDVALDEFIEQGGVTARFEKYNKFNKKIKEELREYGLKEYLDPDVQGNILTSYYFPNDNFDYNKYCDDLSKVNIHIYPSSLTKENTFRIGNIGDINENELSYIIYYLKYFIENN